jgi:hypothetical protein
MPEAVESSDGRISSLRVGMPEDLAKTVLSDFGVGVPSAETKAAFRGWEARDEVPVTFPKIGSGDLRTGSFVDVMVGPDGLADWSSTLSWGEGAVRLEEDRPILKVRMSSSIIWSERVELTWRSTSPCV